MTIAMSPHHYFAIFLFVIYAITSIVTSSATSCRVKEKPAESYPVDFECDLNVEELTETSYREFITNLRTELAKGGTEAHDVPILPYYPKDNVHLFDVLVTTKTDYTIVRIRRDNLYVRGYFLTDLTKWMEFKDTEKVGRKMIPGSEIIPFGDSYGEMEKRAGTLVTDIKYGKTILGNAVASLSQPLTEGKDKGKLQAKALIIMAQMISEAARFANISTFFGSQLKEGKQLPQWMFDLEKSWGRLSTVVQCYDQYNPTYKYKEETINGKVYKTVQDLCTIFGIMKKETKINEKSTCGIKSIAYEQEGEGAVELSVDIQ